jgi:hypothetical protein
MPTLRENLLDRFRMLHADELLVETAVEVRQTVRVEAETLQHRRVHVLDLVGVFDRRAAEFVGLPDADAALDAAARHPHREAVGVVVAARALLILGGRLTPELAAPDNKRGV